MFPRGDALGAREARDAPSEPRDLRRQGVVASEREIAVRRARRRGRARRGPRGARRRGFRRARRFGRAGDASRRGFVSRAFALVTVAASAAVAAVRGLERRAPRASGRDGRARLAVILPRVSRPRRFDATRARLAASTLAALETLQSLARLPPLALVALALARLRPRQHALSALGEALQLEELTHQRLEIGAGRGGRTRRRPGRRCVASRASAGGRRHRRVPSGRARATRVCGSSAFSDPSSLLFGRRGTGKLKCVEGLENPICRPTAEGAKIFENPEVSAVEIRKIKKCRHDGAKIFGSVKRRNAGFMTQKCDPMRVARPIRNAPNGFAFWRFLELWGRRGDAQSWRASEGSTRRRGSERTGV